MASEAAEDVLRFWFPESPSQAPSVQQVEWWFRGGADAEVLGRFAPLLERAKRGELDGWAHAPRSRLALILVLDQFSRSIHRGNAEAFGQDARALALALEGIRIGHYAALATPWEKTFFFLPLGHSEDLEKLDLVVGLAEALVREVPPGIGDWLAFSASQARGNRDVIARFGRHPHRNAALGRESTPAEREYLATGELVHTRSFSARS